MRLKVFLAFQFGNAKLSRSDKEIALINAINQVNEELKEKQVKIQLYWEDFNLKSGLTIGDQLYRQIEKSGVFIADLSEMNKNVLFELGIAYTFEKLYDKPIIWLVRESVNLEEFPADIKGLFYLKYDNISIKSILSYALKEKVLELNLEKLLSDWCIEFWKLNVYKQIDILCSEIPEEIKPYYSDIKDRNYLRYAKFADLDTLIYLRTNLTKYCSDLMIRDFSASEYCDSSINQLFIIGGPPWNPKYEEFQKMLPFSFESNKLGEDDPLCLKDKKLYPKWTKDKEIIYDVSVYSRLVFNNNYIVHMFGGCLTYGVLGSAKVFLGKDYLYENLSWILEYVDLTKSFALVFPSYVLNSNVISPHIEKGEFIYLFTEVNKNSPMILKYYKDENTNTNC